MKGLLATCLVVFGVTCFTARASDSPANVNRQTWDTESGLPQNTVHAIYQTRDGYMWFGTEGGLARFDGVRFTVFNSRNTRAMHSNDIRALLEDEVGTLWIATAGGITTHTGYKFDDFTTADGLPSNSVTGLYRDDSRRVCAVTSSGIACFDDGHFEVQPRAAAPHPPQLDLSLQKFVASPMLCSFKDREGDTWVGSEATGVTIIRALHFEAFSDHAQGLDDQVRCVYRDRKGAIWFGTDSQGLTRYENGSFTKFTAATGLSSDVIVALGEDASGDLLVGTPDGLDRLQNGVITAVTSSDGLPDDFIRSIHTDTDGTIWLGTRRGLASIHNNEFRTYTHNDGLGSDLIGSITRDSAGALWVATLHGLSRMEGTRFHNYIYSDGLPSGIITALYPEPGGPLWIGTQGGGLVRRSNGVFKRVIAPGMPAVIYGITRDAQGTLWLASDSGVFRVSLNSASADVMSYGVNDGLRVNECSGGGHPGVALSPNGAIWFATLKGAALLRPDVPFNRVPPPVTIESLIVDGNSLRGNPIVPVRPGASRFLFNYSAMSFTAPQKVKFRYRLQGFDKDWQDTTERTAIYTNLGQGYYTFQVIARNGDGVWNTKGDGWPIHVEARFHQTWWFALTVILTLAASAYGIYRWRLLRVEDQLEARFEAVLQERNRIAREIHDTLAQGFAGVSLQLELVSRKLDSTSNAREHLDQARMLVRSSLAEARRSIWELRSQSSEIEDLASRLSKMATQMGGPGNPKIAVQVRGSYKPLPPRTEDELLRIAQEAVTNAIRHAQATQIDIELAFDPKLLRMTVADDGRGFSPTGSTTGVNGHFGLKGMQERANGLNAKLNLDTQPGAGTRLSVELTV